jgi:hypothetical protein
LKKTRLPILNDGGIGEDTGEHNAHQKGSGKKVGSVTGLGHARTQDQPEKECRTQSPHDAAGLAVKADQFSLAKGVSGGPKNHLKPQVFHREDAEKITNLETTKPKTLSCKNT